jgi:hypothetical protein
MVPWAFWSLYALVPVGKNAAALIDFRFLQSFFLKRAKKNICSWQFSW